MSTVDHRTASAISLERMAVQPGMVGADYSDFSVVLIRRGSGYRDGLGRAALA
jgi:hypothetical protein